MRSILFFLITLSLYGCNKPKTVLICGDHICVNKAEAKQYFEKNLSLEVKIIDKKKADNVDLVELNLKPNSNGMKKVNIFRKNKTKNNIKILTKDEIKKKKAELKKNEKQIKKAKLVKKVKKKSNVVKPMNKVLKTTNKTNVKTNDLMDICKILNKCDIDEISDYLIRLSKEKKFPDITKRE